MILTIYNQNVKFYKIKKKQEVSDDLTVCVLNILRKACNISSLVAINLMKMEMEIFQTFTWPPVDHLIKGSCLGASNTQSALWLLWCRYIFCRWRFVFYLPREPVRPLHWDVMHIYQWELLATCRSSEESSDYRHFDSLEEKCFIKHMNHINMYCPWNRNQLS